MIPGQDEAVEMLSEALLQTWVNLGLLQSGGLQAYPPDQQPRIKDEARFQARALLADFSPPLTAEELRAPA